MPRNRFIKQVRKSERAVIAHQVAELAAIARYLHFRDAEPVEEINPAKARRSARLEHKRRRKLLRRSASVE